MTHLNKLPTIEKINKLDQYRKNFTLSDGRNLSYTIYGTEDGRPTFYFHGGPSSRLEGALLHSPSKERGYMLICIDRPGHGYSDMKPGYLIKDLAEDVRELADHMGIDQFGVMGTSGGGPPVIACAYALSDRLEFALFSGGAAPIYTDPVASKALSPLDRIMAKIGARSPRWLFKIIMGATMRYFLSIKTPEQYIKTVGSMLSETDRQTVRQHPEFIPAFLHSIKESYRQGAGGPTDDTVAIVKDWGFSLKDVHFQVLLSHGTEDVHVPFSFSEFMHANLPKSKLIPLEGQGHYVHLVNPNKSFDIIEGKY